MELMSENIELEVSTSILNSPIHQTSIANEDLAITTEVVSEKYDVVEIEKTSVIQKKVIVTEKYVVPKQNVIYHPTQIWGENPAVPIQGSATQDGEGSCNTDAASQESDSRMEISSQESDSPMECSSQEADTLNSPPSDGYVPNKEAVAIKESISKSEASEAMLGKENGILKHSDVLLIEKELCKKASATGKHSLPHKDYPDEGFVPQEEELNLNESMLENGLFETKLNSGNNEVDGEYCEGRLPAKRCLLLREEAVAAREAACSSRERAIEEREAALYGNNLRGTIDDSPSPKRVKY